MGITPKLLLGKVKHGRLFPKRSSFTYRIYYLVIPLAQRKSLPISCNRPAPLSFYDQDHGNCDGGDLTQWARNILACYGANVSNGDFTLICMPRVLGYEFNPVSFWLCRDSDGDLRSVLCEVHNTFGERHTYFCAHEDHRPIMSNDRLKAKKVFHVSPFLKRDGNYEFRFDIRGMELSICIDYYDVDGKKQLITSLSGDLVPMNANTLRKVFWCYPLITLKAITMIHWQALRLLVKGVRYIPKPPQIRASTSSTDHLKKM